MKNLITRLLEAAHHYTVCDFAVFKICLLSIGILLGSYFSNFFLKYNPVIWILAIITLILIWARTIHHIK